jgi:hypothetical protein
MNAKSLSLIGVIAAVLAVHGSRRIESEPFFNNDETRHLMSGVFFRDVIHDAPTKEIKKYAVDYYLQRPALGLLVWPPGFYSLLGGWMTIFGPSLAAAKSLVLVFLVVALLYTYAFARHRLSPLGALTATALVGFSPIVFEFSEFVMLEIPTFTCAMAAIVHLERYLRNTSPPAAGGGRRGAAGGGPVESDRGPVGTDPDPVREARTDLPQRLGEVWEIWLCAFWIAAAGWMRYDAVFLAPYVLLRLAIGGDWRAALNRHVIGAMAFTAIAVGPLYYITFKQYSGGMAAAASGTHAESQQLSPFFKAAYYFVTAPKQMGWPVVAFGGLGLLLALRRWKANASLFALVGSVWLTFSAMAELESRHAIYWIPAWCVAAVAVFEGRRTRIAALALFVGWQAWSAWQSPNMYVRGYRAAAQFVVAKSPRTPVVVFDGLLNGGFIHALALRDADRKWTTIRADKLLYGVLSEKSGGYAEWAKDEQAMLDAMYRFDPEFVIVEDPRVLEPIPAADRLRKLLASRKDRFKLEVEIPIDSNQHAFLGRRLLVYRSLIRNPNPERLTELNMLSLGGTLKSE